MYTWWASWSNSAPVRRSEPNNLGLLDEGQFRTSAGQGHEAQFVDDQQAEPGKRLEVEQLYLVPGLHQFVVKGRDPQGIGSRYQVFDPAREEIALSSIGTCSAVPSACVDIFTPSGPQ